MKPNKILKYTLFCLALSVTATGCSDFFEPENKTILNGDNYIKENSEMYSGFTGIMTKVQAMADKAIYLTDARAEMFVPTDRSDEMIALSDYQDNLTGNKYADPALFYDVIIACNDYLAKISDYKKKAVNLDESHYNGLVASAVRIKVYTYFTMAKIYNQVVWFDDPMQSMKDYSQYPKYDLDQTIQACVDLLNKGYDGVPSNAEMKWSEWLESGNSDVTSGTYASWDYMTPPYFVLAGELALWQGRYQDCVDQVLGNLNTAFSTATRTASYIKWMCNAGYGPGNYFRIFNGQAMRSNVVVDGITYNYQKSQTNQLTANFYSGAATLRPTDNSAARYSDPDFNPLEDPIKSKDPRFSQILEDQGQGLWRLRRYRDSNGQSAIYLHRNVELYLMLIECFNHLDRYVDMYALMNEGVDYYYKNKKDLYEKNFKGFNEWWTQFDAGRITYPDTGVRGTMGLKNRELKTLESEDNIRYNDMEILKEYMLEFPGEGKTLPAMIRMARRYNDNTIISNLVCGKYLKEDEAKASSIKAKIDAGDYFVHWDIDSTSSMH